MGEVTPVSTDGFRIEHDSMGEVRVPAHALWGAQTQRAVENFPISGQPVDGSIVEALAILKGTCAEVNGELGTIDAAVAEAIGSAAHEVASGRHADQFPVDVFQTGSGTSTNMNMNEVLAHLAGERLGRTVSPNDEVNASQSSNDIFPSAIHLAVVRKIETNLVPALEELSTELRGKARDFAALVKSGRTHLMDATPVTLGQEFGGYASAVDNGIERLRSILPRVGELPLGGTAVGTGLNAKPGFAAEVIEHLRQETGLVVTEAQDHFEAQGARDGLVEASGVLRTIAVSLYKIANDLRWMSSGPRCGLGEIHLPDLQPGSSIMPGKVNPVVPEAVCQVVAQVIGNDAAIAFGGASGNFELNIMVPVIGRNLLESIRLLASASRALAAKCVVGIVADAERCRAYALSSASIATALNPYIGYENAAKVVRRSLEEGKDLRTVVLEMGLLGEAEVDRALDVLAMTRGGIIG
ncbi:MAG TPA: class II fumarate hydratase [Acidimicrobiales bacterium]|nr:class II fumarate hydratase [Acidimicrobiales bacterium]